MFDVHGRRRLGVSVKHDERQQSLHKCNAVDVHAIFALVIRSKNSERFRVFRRKYLIGFAGLVAQHGQFVDSQIRRQPVYGRFHLGQIHPVSSDFDLRVGPALVQQHAVHDSPVVPGPIHPFHAQTYTFNALGLIM